MISEIQFKQIRWASRRGMLELDLLLVPFVEDRFRELPFTVQEQYVRLLECEDNTLFAWLLGRSRSDDQQLAGIIDQIIEHSRKSK